MQEKKGLGLYNVVIIGAGTRAGIPPIEGLRDVTYFTNETIFDELIEKPESMIVLGGGPIGCELGQAFNRLGVKVTIFQSADQILPPEDVDVADFMQQRFAAEEVSVRLNSAANRLSMRDGKVVLEFEDETITADTMLIAAGRTPNLRALNLEAAGVKYDDN